MRMLLAIDFELEERLLEGIIRDGHEIVDRVIGAAALAEAVERWRPEVTLVQASPDNLAPESLAACDRAGCRTIVVTGSPIERSNAAALGITERVDATVTWSQIAALLEQPAEARVTNSGGPGPLAAHDLPASAHNTDTHPGAASRRELRRREAEGKQHGRVNGAGRSAQSGRSHELAGGVGDESARQRPSASDGAPRAALEKDAPKTTHGTATAPVRSPRKKFSIFSRAGAKTQPFEHPLGRSTAVWGPHGSPGVTTIAVGLAAALAARGRRVLLIDADPYGGAIAPLLGISDESPGLAAACRLAGVDALNASELERVCSKAGRAGAMFSVLTGIANPERWPELTSSRMSAVITAAKLHMDDVVIDTGFNLETDEELVSDFAAPRRNAATLTALERVDRVVAVAEGTPLGLHRFLRAHRELATHMAEHTVMLTVANRVRQGAVGLDAGSQVRQALLRFGGIADPVLLPDDHKAADRATGDGASLVDVAPRSQLSRGVQALADRLDAWLPPAAVVQEPRGSSVGAP